MIIAVIVVTGWSFGARQLRAQTLSLRNRDFLESARVRGERRSYIIVMEVLPTMSSLILANFLGAAVYSVLAAAGLQFLGLGDTSASSWGTMLYWSQNQNALLGGLPAWSVAPGLCIALLGAAFALLNYAFDEISNPALRPVLEAPGQAPILRFATSPSSTRPRTGAQWERWTQVNLEVPPGEFLGVVGESGCGKSTMLFAIAQLLSPPAAITGGTVRFHGQNLVTMTEKQLNVLRWRDYSVVMQSAMNALNPVKSIRAQFEDALDAHEGIP